MKVKAQIFHSDYTCEIVNADLKNEEIIVGPYRFSAKKVRPFIIHKLGIFSQPLYIFKSVSMVPLAFEPVEEIVDKYSVTYIEPIQDLRFYEKDLRFNAELAKDISNMTFLKELMKYVGATEEKAFEWKKLFLILGALLIILGIFFVFANPEAMAWLRKALNLPI